MVHHPFHRDPFHVGDRSEMVVNIDGTAQLDGNEYREHRASKRRNEIVAMDGGRLKTVRIELLEQTSVINGVAQPTVLGAFLVEMRGGKLAVTKADGSTPTEHERTYIEAVSAQTFRAPAASMERAYEVGKPVHLSSDEAVAFGLGSGATAELTLTAVSDDEFLVQLAGVEKAHESAGTAQVGKKWSGQIRISRHGPRAEHWRMQVDLFDDRGVAGHSDQRLDYRLIPSRRAP